MGKRNVYLVQVDILRKTPMFYSAYLPYTSGALWAFARQSPVVDEHYSLREIFFLRDPVQDVTTRMDAPFLIGFSCYLWNMEYNKALAQLVRQAYPACHILFGGHHVPPGGKALEDLPCVDFLIHGEGEQPFQALLTELAQETPDFTRVPGLSYRTGQHTETNPESAPATIEDFPSPYLEGIFDPIIAAHPEIQWSTVWETNRGCPHHCAFCDWGLHNAKVRAYPMERILAEIDWICANKVEYIWCADANFGILPQDEAILNTLAEARKRTGYPYVFYGPTAKALNERMFRIMKKLNDSGLDKIGPSFAMQSLAPAVLRNIGRVNFPDEEISWWIRRCRQAGYRTHTALILGLPGETLQSFCAGVEKLCALGQHDGIVCLPCYLLPNATMAVPAYREKHGIHATRKIFKQIMEDVPEADQIDEYIEMVDETAAMSHADWLTAHFFMFLVQSAHGYGLLRLAAMYLHMEKLVSYTGFYLSLLDFCHARPDTLPGEAMAEMERYFTDAAHGKESELLQIPGFSFGRMFEDQYFFSRAVLDPNRFYADAAVFLRQLCPKNELLEQLLHYQRECIMLPGAAVKVQKFAYDFPSYFNAIYEGTAIALEKKPVCLRFSTTLDVSSSEKYFDTIVWRGRLSSHAFYQIERIDP